LVDETSCVGGAWPGIPPTRCITLVVSNRLFAVHGENGKRGSGEKVASDGAEASERSLVGPSHSDNDQCCRAGARNRRDLSSGIANPDLSSIAPEHTV